MFSLSRQAADLPQPSRKHSKPEFNRNYFYTNFADYLKNIFVFFYLIFEVSFCDDVLMATSKSKSTISILRAILAENGSLETFAALIGKSTSWVLQASSARIPLTREAAFQIAMATGVNPEWLLSGDTRVPPIALNSSENYTLETFKRHRDQSKLSFTALMDPVTEAALEKIPATLVKIIEAIYVAGKSPYEFREILRALEDFERFCTDRSEAMIQATPAIISDSRKTAFARLALRSALAQIKRSSKKNPAQPTSDLAEN